MKMNEKFEELCKMVGCNLDLMEWRRMTTDEILDCIHCGLDEEGEIIDLDTGKTTGIWYDEID